MKVEVIQMPITQLKWLMEEAGRIGGLRAIEESKEYTSKSKIMLKLGIKSYETLDKKIERGEVIKTEAGTYKIRKGAGGS